MGWFKSKWMGLVLGVASVGVMGLVVWHPGAFDWEIRFYHWWFKMAYPLGPVWVLISALYPVAGLVALVVVWNFWRNSKKDELLLSVLIISGAVIAKVLKKIIHRPCPPESILSAYPTVTNWINKWWGADVMVVKTPMDYCWPSGHVLAYVVLFGGVGLLGAFHVLPKAREKKWLMILSWVSVGLIGLSRLFLGQHLVLDVIGGYVIGFLWLWLVFRVIEYGV